MTYTNTYTNIHTRTNRYTDTTKSHQRTHNTLIHTSTQECNRVDYFHLRTDTRWVSRSAWATIQIYYTFSFLQLPTSIVKLYRLATLLCTSTNPHLPCSSTFLRIPFPDVCVYHFHCCSGPWEWDGRGAESAAGDGVSSSWWKRD
jgi:hypothetical protein